MNFRSSWSVPKTIFDTVPGNRLALLDSNISAAGAAKTLAQRGDVSKVEESLVVPGEGVQEGGGTGVRGLAPHGGGWPSGARSCPRQSDRPSGCAQMLDICEILNRSRSRASRACERFPAHSARPQRSGPSGCGCADRAPEVQRVPSRASPCPPCTPSSRPCDKPHRPRTRDSSPGCANVSTAPTGLSFESASSRRLPITVSIITLHQIPPCLRNFNLGDKVSPTRDALQLFVPHSTPQRPTILLSSVVNQLREKFINFHADMLLDTCLAAEARDT